MPISKRQLEGDRREGAIHEGNFCKLMQTLGYWTYRYQAMKVTGSVVLERGDERIILPDVWLVKSPTLEFYAEVKGKTHTYGVYAPENCFGLERYRLESALKLAELVSVPVIYVIYHKKNKEDLKGIVEQWVWQEFKTLAKKIHEEQWGESYVANEVKRVPICYWKVEVFIPLVRNGKLNLA